MTLLVHFSKSTHTDTHIHQHSCTSTMSVQPRYPTPLAPASDGRRLEHVVAVGAAYCSIAAKNAKTAATDTWVEYEDAVIVYDPKNPATLKKGQTFPRWNKGAGQSNDVYTQDDIEKYKLVPLPWPEMQKWTGQWRQKRGVTGKIAWKPSDEFRRGEVRWGVFENPIFKHWNETMMEMGLGPIDEDGSFPKDWTPEEEEEQKRLIVRVQRVDTPMEKEPSYTINAEIITRVDGVWKSYDDLHPPVLPVAPQKMTSDDTSEEDEETSSSSEQESYNTAEEELSED